MVIAALLLICSIPHMDDTAKVVSDSSAVASDSATSDSVLVASLPPAPEPNVKADPKLIAPHLATQPFLPMKPVFTGPRETPRQRKVWYGLALAGHSGAAFDAWTTHPFANSNAIYAATQVSPAVIDYLGKRMMVSQHGWVRKIWWLPQTAGASISFVCGAHNLGVVR